MNNTIYKIGYWSGILAFGSTLAFTFVQLLQLLHVLTYPLDEFLIYGFSLCIVIPFMVEMLALHYLTAPEKKFQSHTALLFTLCYVVFVTSNYVVQLATVIPATLRVNAADNRILQQTPHSLFWDFDAIRYIFMGLATLSAVPIFEKKGYQNWIRNVFLIHALVTPLIAFVYFYPHFSKQLLLIAIPGSITAPYPCWYQLYFIRNRIG